MENEEKVNSLIAKCFEEIEDHTSAFASQLFLNYNLYDDDDEKEKFRYIKKNIKRFKKELGKINGDLAESINDIYSLKINFPDYNNFYEMAYNRLKEPLKEFIEWTIYFENEGENIHNKEKYIDGQAAKEYDSLKKWIKAVSKCLNLHLLEEHVPYFDEDDVPLIREDFYSKRKTSELIKFRNGRRLNLKERYILMDEFIGIDSAIKKLKIKNEDKEKLLAHLLSCNPKNAQQILNGTYDSKVREIEIKEYLKSIKKE